MSKQELLTILYKLPDNVTIKVHTENGYLEVLTGVVYDSRLDTAWIVADQ